MVDEFVRQKLKDYGLSHYENVFNDEEINEEAFKLLDEAAIKQIIRKTGPCSIFLRKWNEEYRNFIPFIDVSEVVVDPRQNLTYPSILNVSSESVSGDSVSQVLSSPAVDSRSTTPDHTEVRVYPLDSVDLTPMVFLPITDLVETLKNSLIGLCVLTYYKEYKVLTDTLKTLLCDAILDIELRTNSDMLVEPDRFKILSQMIVKIFPTEVTATYYVPYVAKTETSPRVLARGRFVERYQHYRTLLIRSTVSSRKKGAKKITIDKNSVVKFGSSDILVEDTDEECERILEELHNCIDPPEKIEEYWKKTSKARIKTLVLNEGIENFDYINEFPALKHTVNGLKLIKLDFEVHHPEKTTLLLDKYGCFERQILSYTKTKKKNAEVKQLLREHGESLNDDSTIAITFLLLSSFLAIPTIRCGKNTLRPEREIINNNFLMHVKDEEDDLERNLHLRREYLSAHKFPAQPMIIVVGKSLKEIEKSLVLVNDTRYVATSTLDAIDTTFKSFYSLQVDYPQTAGNVWKFIQHYFYGISVQGEQIPQTITNLMNTLRHQQ